MTERPILFRGPLVRAILAGKKTMTRRLIKPQPVAMGLDFEWRYARHAAIVSRDPSKSESLVARCPYGRPGDRFWVRETLALDVRSFGDGGKAVNVLYRATDPKMGEQPECWIDIPEGERAWVKRQLGKQKKHGLPVWTPSIYCKRWLSRINLEITEVRAERLQQISARDILAEGVVERAHNHDMLGKMPVSALDGCAYVDLKSLWSSAWDSINKAKAPWASNPWVWAITFRRIA